jgi:hypothetical protein
MRHVFVRGAAVSLLLVFFAGGWPSRVHAWNDRGHMVVAYIAYQHLSDTTRQRVAQLLSLNPQHSLWLESAPLHASAKQKELTAFMKAATWPDFIKGAPDYTSDGTHGGNTPPPDPSASQNIGYVDKNMHKYWHFIDVPFSPDSTPTVQPDTPNALTEIKLLTTALASASTSDEIKSYDLVWLLHLVGDVHQPLHATSRFTKSDPDGDNGGNDVKPHCTGVVDCPPRLHALWDGLLGLNSKFGSVVLAGRILNKRPAPAGADVSDPDAWIQEGTTLAQTTVYKTAHTPPTDLGDPIANVDLAYFKKAGAVGNARVHLAGLRLAALITTALGQ